MAINPGQLLQQKKIELAAINRKKLKLLEALDFSERQGTKQDYLKKLSPQVKDLLREASRQRMDSRKGLPPESPPGITQSELQALYIEYWAALKDESIKRANAAPIQVVQGGAVGSKK